MSREKIIKKKSSNEKNSTIIKKCKKKNSIGPALLQIMRITYIFLSYILIKKKPFIGKSIQIDLKYNF